VCIGATTILRGVELQLRAGEVAALTGANGSGKSTLLRVLAGLHRVTHGHVTAALPAAGQPGQVPVALVAHEPSLHAALTLRENLDLVAAILGQGPDAVGRSLERVGLGAAADRPLGACSQGMVRRAELARVLLTDPRLLLLDEAHAALDPTARALVTEIARSVATGGGAAVVVTHDVHDAGRWSDRVLAVRDGRVHEVET
jgi:ABC-type multidrug transport system ATPase subunit